MKFINRLLLTYYSPLLRQLDTSIHRYEASQHETFRQLMQHMDSTRFAQEHQLDHNSDYEQFRKQVPVREYDDFQPYIHSIQCGEQNILWNEPVQWFAKSSGTSSGKSKFIPITPANLKHCHYRGFQLMLAHYLRQHPDSGMMYGKALTLGGSVAADSRTGDLSAILLQNSPKVAEWIRTPERKTALIPNFEQKVEQICRECSHKNVTSFSGVPSWNLLLLRRILDYAGKGNLLEIWPNLELFMHGGTYFEPYREQFRKLIPSDQMHYLENYNASEGYFAFQDDLQEQGMRLVLDNGVFYEFIPLEQLPKVLDGDLSPILPLSGIQVGQEYALVISTNSGLWRYLIGDTVRFTSNQPHRIIITGRTQLYINTFGEELMINNAEKALAVACQATGAIVSEYTVAPIFFQGSEKGRHEWLIEFETQPQVSLENFAEKLDQALCQQNSDYEAKRNGTMERLKITSIPKGTFYRWMEQRGKVGGQNKVPRLYPKRDFIEQLNQLIIN
ncbi:MAG: GH3 auxin-responsive promoter family protein [Bacteroidales bacterium]|nr:GH3 auxin-responsive promoter family protein [Bacteroidales bacterium]